MDLIIIIAIYTIDSMWWSECYIYKTEKQTKTFFVGIFKTPQVLRQ